MTLLAVDLGFRAGLAAYGADGRLQWYRSTNFGSRARMKKAAPGVVRSLEGLTDVVLEGDAGLAVPWVRAAEAVGAATELIGADLWRPVVLPERHRRSGHDAKLHAIDAAVKVIAWSGAKAPKGPLRHDAAEAILIGLWAVLQRGWLAEPPIPVV